MSDKQREIITVNVGGAGCAIGQNVLQQFATEYGISRLGYKQRETRNDSTKRILFDETSKGKFMSRTLFTDLDPYCIENIRTRYPFRSLLQSGCSLLSGNHDTCFNYAIGHYEKGKSLMNDINNALRALVEACDNIQGFLFIHSMSGGTGGGFGSLILERMSVDYRKKTKLAMSVFFDSDRASSMEVYNALLTQSQLLEDTDIDIVFDNKACNKICRDILKTNRTTYKHYNSLITKMIGDITSSSRFAKNEILTSLHMDFCPFPRLHFLTSSMWPLIPRNRNTETIPIFKNDVKTLMNQCLESKHFMVDTPDFDVEEDKNMAISFCCRGDDCTQLMSECNAAVQFMRMNKKLTFTEWTSSKPMVKFVDSKASQLQQDNMMVTDKQISMLMNNISISRLYSDRISKPYDILSRNRCYMHHYTSNGMEEKEFSEARENLGFLEKDYLDVISDQQTDDYDDDDDDDDY